MNRHLASIAVIALVAGCSRGMKQEPTAFSWTDQLPAGSSLHIRNGSGKIEIATVPGSTLRVIGGRSWRRGRQSDVNFQVTHAGNDNDVYVCAMWRASGRCGPSGYRGKRTESFLSFLSLFHRSTDATASFVVELPPGVSVDATTTIGSVTISGVHAGVTARSVTGSVTAIHVSGPVSLATTNGAIQLSVDSLGDADSVKATAVNGLIRAELPANTQGDFDISAVNGMVRTDFALPPPGGRRHNSIIGRIGTTPRMVKLHATNGSVALLKSPSADSVAVAPATPPPPATAPRSR